ncbi:hypothetical protein QMO56_21195 [Roseomonas sp. E05]|uniref:hypothetical protein n=1 Tax=Roseomonas sp. E05 TaxID=3046310 RepID=UPI0024BBDB5A|nr:hypothetical protein [Roseomonas sp. E05]MDJ0390634.1 hypothetical protein [Roseomonas sp. E05]
MRTYRVAGMANERTAGLIRKKLQDHFGTLVTVETDLRSGEVRIDLSSDPQIVGFLIDSAGCSVTSVSD